MATKEDRGDPRDSLRALLEMRNARSRGWAMQSPLRVVSFTDPNDILSYVLVPSQPVAPFDVVG